MAGDWIKMETELHEKPEVIEMAGILGLDRFSVVGRLHRVWSWFNKHTESGHARSVTFVTVDEFTSCDGFSAAMEKVGWAEIKNKEFTIPKFDRHNGNSAKSRALAAERKKQSRAKSDACHGASVTETGQQRDQRREEKRRDVHTHSPAPGFPSKEDVLEFCEKQKWSKESGLSFWLHYDEQRSNGDRSLGPNWHWWSRLEKWVMDDARKNLNQKNGNNPSSSNTSSRNRGTANEGRESQYGSIG